MPRTPKEHLIFRRTSLILPAFLATTVVTSASASHVVFERGGAGSQVDVDVDGTLVLDNVQTGDALALPDTLSRGTHTIVGTPSTAAFGQQDLLRTVLTLPKTGAYMLALEEAVDHGLELALDRLNVTAE